MASSRRHLVALPFPAQGHMSPMLHLCKRIAAQGFRVSYVVPSSVYGEMKQHWKALPGLDLHLESFESPVNIPHGMDIGAAFRAVEFFSDLRKMNDPLEELFTRFDAEGFPVCCILSDAFLPWTEDLASKVGIPRLSIWPGGATWAAYELNGKDIFEMKDAELRESIDLPGLPTFRGAEVPYYLRVPDEGPTAGMPALFIERSISLQKTSRMLVNSFRELEEFTFKSMEGRFVPVGPLFLVDKNNSETGPKNVVLRKEQHECLEWLGKQPKSSVLYISFGSLAPLILPQFEELAAALESCKHPFLWVVRLELFINFDDEFKKKYREFLERTSGFGMAISWGPQLQILQHEAVGGFLTHCGWNSTMESICNGVPLIGWPWSGDQNINCKLIVEDWKIGTMVPTKGYSEVVGRNLIQQSIDGVMVEGAEFRSNVQRFKALGIKAVEKEGESLRNLQKFLEELINDF